MIGNYALYLALRLVALVLPIIPVSAAYRLAELSGIAAYYLFPIPRRLIRKNLGIVMGRPSDAAEVRRSAKRAFQNDAKNWVDTLRIAGVTAEYLRRSIDLDPGDWQRLLDPLASGQGVILVMLHLGNYDMVGQLIVLDGVSLTVPVERIKPPALYEFLTRERRRKGINAVPIEQAPRALLRAIRNGELVALAGDRAAAGKCAPVQFFGHVAQLPVGAVSLARRTGASVLIACAVRADRTKFRGVISETVAIVHTDDAEADDLTNTQRLAGIMERIIAQYPDQWLMFEDLWHDGRNVAATMGRIKEPAV